jgi:hypothetical protein
MPKVPTEAASNLVLRRTAIVVAAGRNGSGT